MCLTCRSQRRPSAATRRRTEFAEGIGMSKSDWQANLAEFMPLYGAGAYTPEEFFWFALPLFDGKAEDEKLWDALPQEVKDRFIAHTGKNTTTGDTAGIALAEKLAAVRRAATR